MHSPSVRPVAFRLSSPPSEGSPHKTCLEDALHRKESGTIAPAISAGLAWPASVGPVLYVVRKLLRAHVTHFNHLQLHLPSSDSRRVEFSIDLQWVVKQMSRRQGRPSQNSRLVRLGNRFTAYTRVVWALSQTEDNMLAKTYKRMMLQTESLAMR